MTELIDTTPNCEVLAPEYSRLLGFPANYELTGRSHELAEWARCWYRENGKPWVYARVTDKLNIASGQIIIESIPLSARLLRKQMVEAQAHAAVLVAVSAGEELEAKARQLWQEEKPDEYFFLEVYGAAVVEHLLTTTGARYCSWAEQREMAVLPAQSPGYPGWEIRDQIQLLQLIHSNPARAIPGELAVLESGMLSPKKSQLAVFGVTRHTATVEKLTELIPCRNCFMNACQYRRAPHQYARVPGEGSARASAVDTNIPGRDSENKPLQSAPANYSTSARALQKWSRERLQLRHLEDRSIEARFRYEGTTCSNLGQRLEYDYEVRLSPPSLGCKIVDMSCAPAPGDFGHTYMCKYLSDAALLDRTTAQEKPLLGRPLASVLSWQRPYSPAGCYCEAASRAHKWGLVLEVIHYALAQQQMTTIHARED